MAKILITSDWHIEEGIYVDICLDYIEHLISYCATNDIKDIVIAGDIFEKSTKIKNEAFLPLFFKFMEMRDNGFNLIFILGNHDIYNVDNNSLVEAFSPFGKVVKNFERIEMYDRVFDLLAYTKDEDDIPDGDDVLITHLSIASFTFDNKYHVNEKVAFSPSLFENYKVVFTGHFHRPQNKKNVVYMGSPYQMNFGECGQEKGFVVFDTETGKWKREIYDDAPKYLRIKAEDFKKVDVSNCFVEVEIEQKIDNFVKLKHILYEKGALDVSPSFKEEDDEIKINEEKGDLDLNSSIKDTMKEYLLNGIKADGISNEKLLNIFDQILEKL